MKIGFINYLHSYPFQFLKLECTSYFDSPKNLNIQLAKGGLDAAFISTSQHLNSQYTHLSSLCIASTEKIHSVCLFTKIPLKQLDGKVIKVTSESATSIELLKILCAYYWKIFPRFESFTSTKNIFTQEREVYAFLLIGNEALTLKRFSYQIIDLATQWHQMTSLPFVFALLSSRGSHDPKLDAFSQALSYHLQKKPPFWDLLIRYAQEKTGLAAQDLKTYYQDCRYICGEKELQAIKLFDELRKNVQKNYPEFYSESISGNCALL